MRDFLDDADYEAIDRRRREEARERNEQVAAADAREAAEIKKSSDERSRRANASALLAEYDHAGVPPPFTDADGVPTVSLSMLLWMKWKIEVFNDVRTLVRPPDLPERPRKRREDYERENS